jgi:uncharacterized membrane-anchored protein YhcB (DUF1043 family)
MLLAQPLFLTTITINTSNWHITYDTLIGLVIGLIIGLLLGRMRR